VVLGIKTVSVFGISLAGFQVIMHGRILVFTEVLETLGIHDGEDCLSDLNAA
jgi:hypothetical protein